MEKATQDLTVIYLTASEVSPRLAALARECLVSATDAPIISVSRKPLDFGLNIADDGPRCLSNIYRQLLRAAKVATTRYVAVAEDDCLYHREHFRLRPKHDRVFLYDQNRWALFSWGEPVYSWRNRVSNSTLIAPREYLIEALEERFARWPNGTPEEFTGEVGRHMVEKNLKVTLRDREEQFAKGVAVIQVNHEAASEERQRTQRKSYGPMRADSLYHWGHANDLRKRYE